MKTEQEMTLKQAKGGFTPAIAPLATSTIMTDEHDIQVRKAPDSQVLVDLDHGGDASKLAITGFCWGAHTYGMGVGLTTKKAPQRP